jgi:hypothetical protein
MLFIHARGFLYFNDRLNQMPGLSGQGVVQKILKRVTLQPVRREQRQMDVDLTIRYSDDRFYEVVVCQPNQGPAIYRIVTLRADLGESLTEAMQETRRLYAATPWSYRRPHADA